ncbi:MAG: hypothetical protein DRK00_01225 [Thermoprotei archaeon]|nr:MAG: hypothetical protein DRK00_01225 [Thermoprotei archaeon]
MPVNFIEVLEELLSSLANLVPSILSSVAILVVGYLVGRLTGRAVVGAARLLKLDEGFEASEVGKRLSTAGYPLSRILSILVRTSIYTVTVLAALSLLKIPVVQELSTMIAGYIPRFVGSIIVFLLGIVIVEWLASLIGGLARERALPERVADLAVVGLRYFMYLAVVFMTFEIADIAPRVVSSVAQAVFLALALGVSLALALLIGVGLRNEAPILLFNEPRDLRVGMIVEVGSFRGRVRRISALLVEIEDGKGTVAVVPKKLFIDKGYRILESEAENTN